MTGARSAMSATMDSGLGPAGRPGMTLRRDFHVFEIARLVIDADAGRGDPAGELPRFGDRLHHAADEIAVGLRRLHFAFVAELVRLVGDESRRRDMHVLELADLAMEADMRQLEPKS